MAQEAGLALFLGDFSSPVSVSPPGQNDFYSQMKYVSHLSLASFVIMQPSLALTDPQEETVQLSSHAMQQLSNYLNVIQTQNVRAALADPSRGFSPSQLQRQHHIFDSCYSFLTSAQSAGSFPRSSLAALVTSVRPSLDLNMEDAVADFLRRAHTQMMQWKAELLSETQWAELRVIVLGGSHMARQGLALMQYFSRLLSSAMATELRVIYAEDDETLSNGFPLLATHLLDFSIGAAFYNDPPRMHSDLLAPAAEKFLDDLLPGYPNPNPPVEPQAAKNESHLILIAIAAAGGLLVGIILTHIAHRCYAARSNGSKRASALSPHSFAEMQHGLLSHTPRQSLTTPLVL